MDALALIQVHADECETVEESVECAKRAEVFAERAVDDQGRNDDDAQHDEFPVKEPPELRAEDGLPEVCDDARDRAGWAQVLAECRRQGQGDRKQDDQDQKDSVLQIAEVLVELELILFIEGNKIQEILKESERAQETADDASEECAEKDQKTQYVVGETEPKSAQEVLEGADRTGADGTRAGVAVQARDTDLFCGSGIDLSREKALEIGILDEHGDGLDAVPCSAFAAATGFLSFLIQCRYTPYRCVWPC